MLQLPQTMTINRHLLGPMNTDCHPLSACLGNRQPCCAPSLHQSLTGLCCTLALMTRVQCPSSFVEHLHCCWQFLIQTAFLGQGQVLELLPTVKPTTLSHAAFLAQCLLQNDCNVLQSTERNACTVRNAKGMASTVELSHLEHSFYA